MTSLFGPRVLVKLLQKKYRTEYGCFVVEGKKGVLDAVQSGAKIKQLVVTTDFFREQSEFCALPQIREFFDQSLAVELHESEFRRVVDSVTPQGIAAVVQTPHHELADVFKGKVVAVLEDIRDPGNLGTMIRTADWFGVSGVILIGGADPYQPKVVRSSMGSIFHVPILISQNISQEISELKEQGFRVLVTRPEAPEKPLHSTKVQKTCVIFGNEAEGTSDFIDALADDAFSIPKFGQAESLNVAVSFGILMYELL
jgi:TrmH family RNA methyltransferase